ncbi:MAG: hypothetical protein EBY22_09275 [Gammaproteobacteria bacterium]|nr:hypothetical protein [Gammaproteobacteria bacterium]
MIKSIIYNSEQMIVRLKGLGFKFKSFELISSGSYEIDDADWNYKDVPHLDIIHPLVDSCPAVIADEHVSTIFLQKVFGLKLPMVLYNYESGKDEQTYFSAFMAFILIINTKYSHDSGITTVTTKYNIGGPSILLTLAFPIIKYALSKNYTNLMDGDTPMRLRRGELRAMGAKFSKPGSSYSFRRTLLVNEVNCTFEGPLFSKEESEKIDTIINYEGGAVAKLLTGRSDAWGLRVEIREGHLLVYPRLCEHEGACLDGAVVDQLALRCPWHNKRINPIWEGPVVDQITFQHREKYYSLDVKNMKLAIT